MTQRICVNIFWETNKECISSVWKSSLWRQSRPGWFPGREHLWSAVEPFHIWSGRQSTPGSGWSRAPGFLIPFLKKLRCWYRARECWTPSSSSCCAASLAACCSTPACSIRQRNARLEPCPGQLWKRSFLRAASFPNERIYMYHNYYPGDGV